MGRFFGTWFKDIRWGDFAFYVIGGALAAALTARSSGGSIKDAESAALVTTVSLVAAFLRNPKKLEWQEKGEEDNNDKPSK